MSGKGRRKKSNLLPSDIAAAIETRWGLKRTGDDASEEPSLSKKSNANESKEEDTIYNISNSMPPLLKKKKKEERKQKMPRNFISLSQPLPSEKVNKYVSRNWQPPLKPTPEKDEAAIESKEHASQIQHDKCNNPCLKTSIASEEMFAESNEKKKEINSEHSELLCTSTKSTQKYNPYVDIQEVKEINKSSELNFDSKSACESDNKTGQQMDTMDLEEQNTQKYVQTKILTEQRDENTISQNNLNMNSKTKFSPDNNKEQSTHELQLTEEERLKVDLSDVSKEGNGAERKSQECKLTVNSTSVSALEFTEQCTQEQDLTEDTENCALTDMLNQDEDTMTKLKSVSYSNFIMEQCTQELDLSEQDTLDLTDVFHQKKNEVIKEIPQVMCKFQNASESTIITDKTCIQASSSNNDETYTLQQIENCNSISVSSHGTDNNIVYVSSQIASYNDDDDNEIESSQPLGHSRLISKYLLRTDKSADTVNKITKFDTVGEQSMDLQGIDTVTKGYSCNILAKGEPISVNNGSHNKNSTNMLEGESCNNNETDSLWTNINSPMISKVASCDENYIGLYNEINTIEGGNKTFQSDTLQDKELKITQTEGSYCIANNKPVKENNEINKCQTEKDTQHIMYRSSEREEEDHEIIHNSMVKELTKMDDDKNIHDSQNTLMAISSILLENRSYQNSESLLTPKEDSEQTTNNFKSPLKEQTEICTHNILKLNDSSSPNKEKLNSVQTITCGPNDELAELNTQEAKNKTEETEDTTYNSNQIYSFSENAWDENSSKVGLSKNMLQNANILHTTELGKHNTALDLEVSNIQNKNKDHNKNPLFQPNTSSLNKDLSSENQQNTSIQLSSFTNINNTQSLKGNNGEQVTDNYNRQLRAEQLSLTIQISKQWNEVNTGMKTAEISKQPLLASYKEKIDKKQQKLDKYMVKKHPAPENEHIRENNKSQAIINKINELSSSERISPLQMNQIRSTLRSQNILDEHNNTNMIISAGSVQTYGMKTETRINQIASSLVKIHSDEQNIDEYNGTMNYIKNINPQLATKQAQLNSHTHESLIVVAPTASYTGTHFYDDSVEKNTNLRILQLKKPLAPQCNTSKVASSEPLCKSPVMATEAPDIKDKEWEMTAHNKNLLDDDMGITSSQLQRIENECQLHVEKKPTEPLVCANCMKKSKESKEKLQKIILEIKRLNALITRVRNEIHPLQQSAAPRSNFPLGWGQPK